MSDTYDQDHLLDDQMFEFAAVNGPALVRVWSGGKTDPGWGMPSFMELYPRGRFRPAPILAGAMSGKWAFAIVMRSVRLICIDIDGKNGGLLHAGKLGMLPFTLAETSKSGDGYHLFYSTTEDEWRDKGFAEFSDRISIEQGVDIRATGCVYHYPQQRWNGRQITDLPIHLKDRLRRKQQTAATQIATIIKVLEGDDKEEVAMLHDELLTGLKKSVPVGRRNTTLFAIGSQLFLAQVPNWETLIRDRALQLGLTSNEADKLVRNIAAYAPKVATP